MATRRQNTSNSAWGEALEAALARRDTAVAAWLDQMCNQGEGKRVLELAQRGLTREELAARLGGASRVEAGIRAVEQSLSEFADGGDLATRLAVHALRTTLAAYPAFVGVLRPGPRPGIAGLLLERLEQMEDDMQSEEA